MPNTDAPLLLAKALSEKVNAFWHSGEMLAQVTPITRDLLTFWFSETFCDVRQVNFHTGQRQAILNTIYIHEVLKTKNTFDTCNAIRSFSGFDIDIERISGDKYQNYPKYCHKMATGTGKTWVMHALLLWQYLNAAEGQGEGYSRNFLLIAPGLIVYERLLDAYLGKEQENGLRNFETSDFFVFKDLFIPHEYKERIFGFISNSVFKKEEISLRSSSESMIMITNWHLLKESNEDENDDAKVDTNIFRYSDAIVKDVLPIRPGLSAGSELNVLDKRYFSGSILNFLANLNDLVIINDEAHHIHEGIDGLTEVQWQRSINKIAAKKGEHLIQIDFSATPYTTRGAGERVVKKYFPHIVSDFNLSTAIHAGLVKTITLDRRKELATEALAELDFRAERDERGKAIALSEGQKIMLRAGIAKLNLLEEQFCAFTQHDAQKKYPKMLVMCEDTTVSPLVIDYLQGHCALKEDEVMQIDSNKQGDVSVQQWQDIKRRLFSLDSHAKPRVIVSVLMLREGFDVNNICVIVPLRSSQAPILLEQTVGRGLRLMWRGEEYAEVKEENRKRLFERKEAPQGYFDILSIIEHPAFIRFYEELDEDIATEISDEKEGSPNILGDMIDMPLKEGYEKYDLFFPIIVQEKEEILTEEFLTADKLEPFTRISLEKLKEFANATANEFVSVEMTVGTQFGSYKVDEAVFTSKSYNEFLGKILALVTTVGQKSNNYFPAMQINQARVMGTLDEYIRTRLFSCEFDPLVDDNWRVLLVKNGEYGVIIGHILEQMSRILFETQKNIAIEDAIVIQRYFSEVENMKIRENFCIKVEKSIYEYLPYPSNKGEYERQFMEFVDNDTLVESFIKIKENYHDFATISYLRSDGIIAHYYPDFIVKTANDIYLVETKAAKDMEDKNVLSKKKSALDWVIKINDLNPDTRMDRKWHYCLLSQDVFEQFVQNNANIHDILNFSQISKEQVANTPSLMNYIQ